MNDKTNTAGQSERNAPDIMVRKFSGETDSRSIDIEGAVQPAAAASSAGGILLDNEPVYRTEELDLEVFLRDELVVLLADAQNENDPAFVHVQVNGQPFTVWRGVETRLPRKHVAVLAQAKQTRVRQRKVVNEDGSMGFVDENVMSLTYPFQVIHDPRPRQGRDWLRQLIKNPA